MKHKIYILLLAVFFCSCKKENNRDCITSMGDEITEVRPSYDFDKIYLTDKVNVEYRYADTCFVEVIFGKNVISHIKTPVKDRTLYIRNEGTCQWVRSLKKIPLVRIYAPTLSYIYNTSSAELNFADTLKAVEFMYEQKNANGNVNLLTQTQRIKIYAHTGYTGVRVSGQTQHAGLYSAATGKMNASALIADTAIVNNSSIQDINCVATTYLFGEINLSGNILYTGEPQLVETSIHGTGRVIHQ